MYIWILRLQYNYKLEQKQQIIAKLKWQVLRALNITVNSTQGQTKPIHNPYKDSLDNILDSNVDNIMAITVYINLGPLKQSVSITQLCMLQDIDVLQLSKDFSQVSSKRDKHFSSPVRVKSSFGLPPSIVPLDYSTINTSGISNDWVKQEQPKARAIGAHKEYIRQSTLLGKLKHRSLALERSV